MICERSLRAFVSLYYLKFHCNNYDRSTKHDTKYQKSSSRCQGCNTTLSNVSTKAEISMPCLVLPKLRHSNLHHIHSELMKLYLQNNFLPVLITPFIQFTKNSLFVHFYEVKYRLILFKKLYFKYALWTWNSALMIFSDSISISRESGNL